MYYTKKLYEAVSKNDIKSLKNLIKIYEINETNINSGDLGQTLLHLAARYGHKETLEILIANGATVNITNIGGETPLHKAAGCGHKDIVEILAAHEAKIDVANIYGETPLHYAAWNGDKDTLKILIANEATVNITNIAGNTPLHIAARYGHKDTVEILIAHEAKIDVANNSGDTPLHWPARTGDMEKVKILIQANADINIVNNFGNTPLAFSFEFGSTEVAIELINHGAYLTKDQELEFRLKRFFNKLDRAKDVKGVSKADLAQKLLFNTLSNFLKTDFEKLEEFVKPLEETSGVDLNGIIAFTSLPLRLFSTVKNFKAASADSDVDAEEEAKDNQRSKFNADENDSEATTAILSNDERDNDVKDIISAQLSIQSFDDDLGNAVLIGQD